MPSPHKVLIVEDEKALARALQLKLTAAGFIVAVALDGDEGLAQLAEQKFDVILLDLVMPKRDGFSMLQEMKAKNNKTPVIVSSNLSQQEDIDRAKNLGAVDFYVKSDTSLVEIIEKVKAYLV